MAAQGKLQRQLLAPLGVVLLPVAFMLVFLSLCRMGLALWLTQRVNAHDAWADVLLQGVRFDGVLLGIALMVPAALTALCAVHGRLFSIWRRVLLLYLVLLFVFIAFMELSTPSFIAEYDARPNYVFVEYLKNYREVGATLLAAYPLQLLLAAVVVPSAAWLFLRFARRHTRLQHTVHPLVALPLAVLLFVAFALAGRGALGHRAANPAAAAFSTDHLVNDLGLNSTYSLMYSIYVASKDEEGGVTYGSMPEDKVFSIVRREMGVPQDSFTDPQVPTRHRQTSTTKPQRPLNLVIVLEESLGAEFVGKLGGLPLTPHLDRLADEGIWFSKLFATGTRSIRGIEAVMTGFPPTSARGVVKQINSQRGFFTLASFLREQGYDTTFLYGGESHFDNMRGFFMGNGVNEVMDQKDFPSDAFIATWGASDEDLFDLADRKFRSYGDKPFFSFVFTSSNHSPFEFPDGKIQLYDSPKQTVNNAVKYADHALGQFFAKAKQSPYWENTIFLVVADHNSRVYGSTILPVERFHIPGLILGGPVKKPEVIGSVASQLDLGPTLLSLLGVSGEHPMIGRDLTRAEQRQRPGRAIMQFDKVQAYMEGDEVVVLQPNLAPRFFRYDGKQIQDQPGGRPELADKALAHALFAQAAYARKLYPSAR